LLEFALERRENEAVNEWYYDAVMQLNYYDYFHVKTDRVRNVMSFVSALVH
jgi:hypothetical protein